MTDVIEKKKNGFPLTEGEIRFFTEGYTGGGIPDYQASALLMAVRLNGMDEAETAVLTDAMARSGDTVDLSAIPGVKVDKHSTGGVGDKTTLIAGPIAAACGVPIAKMSGRGLGHTGGTVDKLESIPGFRTSLKPSEFFHTVRTVGISIIGQSVNIAPADKKLYALRGVTATVDSIPLIASSVMSKKLASGADAVLLDVKAGSGAFMKTVDEAVALARAMVDIGKRAGKRCVALVTNMDGPLGRAVGNALEVAEAAETLRGRGPDGLTALCLELASYMLLLGCPRSAGERDTGLGKCRRMAQDALDSGKAFGKFREMVKAQGGDPSVLDDTLKLPQAAVIEPLRADKDGYITRIGAEAVGRASLALGAGRSRKEDRIDHAAGLLLRKITGDRVAAGEVVALLHTNAQSAAADTEARLSEAGAILEKAVVIGDKPPEQRGMIFAVIE